MPWPRRRGEAESRKLGEKRSGPRRTSVQRGPLDPISPCKQRLVDQVADNTADVGALLASESAADIGTDVAAPATPTAVITVAVVAVVVIPVVVVPVAVIAVVPA